jgi:hypothetical protein
MDTFGTNHQSVNDFRTAVALATPGSAIIYAFGDLAVSAPYSGELSGLRTLVQGLAAKGDGCLTQRRRTDARFFRGGGACFEYIFTKASACRCEALHEPKDPRRGVGRGG